jgi:hypothetical protein
MKFNLLVGPRQVGPCLPQLKLFPICSLWSFCHSCSYFSLNMASECLWWLIFNLFFFFFGSQLQRKHSTTWVTPPICLGDGGLTNHLSRLTSNWDPPDLSIPRSQDYRRESLPVIVSLDCQLDCVERLRRSVNKAHLRVYLRGYFQRVIKREKPGLHVDSTIS